jgi:hypothetical protein
MPGKGVNMKSIFAILVSGLFVAASFAAPPPAPTNVIYDAAPKQMIFDWDVVPGANYYEIWFQPQLDIAPVKFAERAAWNPHWTHNLSAHLLHWFDARWEIRACNFDGCSSTGPINVGSTVVNLVGHFKPAHPQPFAAFGSAVDVSEDGNTMVVVASDEQRTAEEESATAVIYVFARINGHWQQQARLLPSRAQTGNGDGVTVSLAGNGNVLAVGIPGESYVGDAPAGQVPVEEQHGAVYVFRRNGTAWRQEQRLDTNGVYYGTGFGLFVGLSDDAKLLVASKRESNDTILYRHTSDGWRLFSTIQYGPVEQIDYALSGSGQYFFARLRTEDTGRVDVFDTSTVTTVAQLPLTLPSPAASYQFSAFAADYAGERILSGAIPKHVAQGSYDPSRWKPEVRVFRKVDGAYTLFSRLLPSSFQPTDYARRSLFGQYATMSHDGEYVAINDPHDARAAPLVQLPPDQRFTGPPRGAIYMFEQKPGRYRLRRHIGAPAYTIDTSIFGAMAFGRDGKTFIAAQPGERSGIGGIDRAADGPANDTSMPGAGAVWLY